MVGYAIWANQCTCLFRRSDESSVQECSEQVVVVFVDNILVYSRSMEGHESHLEDVLSTLRAHQLRAKISKCHFWWNEARFLGTLFPARVWL